MERPVDAGFTPDMEGFTDIVLGQAYSDSASAVLGRLRAVMEDANGFKATFEPIKCVCASFVRMCVYVFARVCVAYFYLLPGRGRPCATTACHF